MTLHSTQHCTTIHSSIWCMRGYHDCDHDLPGDRGCVHGLPAGEGRSTGCSSRGSAVRDCSRLQTVMWTERWNTESCNLDWPVRSDQCSPLDIADQFQGVTKTSSLMLLRTNSRVLYGPERIYYGPLRDSLHAEKPPIYPGSLWHKRAGVATDPDFEWRRLVWDFSHYL